MSGIAGIAIANVTRAGLPATNGISIRLNRGGGQILICTDPGTAGISSGVVGKTLQNQRYR